MSEFPELSRYPIKISETLAFDPTITTEYEDGSTKSRPRFTKLKKKWTLEYSLMTDTDKVLLETLQIDVLAGSYSFDWTTTDIKSCFRSIL